MPSLEVSGLTTVFAGEAGESPAVSDVSFEIAPGERLGLVGESGSGKTVLCNSLLGVIRRPGRIAAGSVKIGGEDLIAATQERRRELRSRRIAIVPQDATGALTPVRRVGQLLVETMQSHLEISADEARRRAIHHLEQVGIPSPEQRLAAYPFELSGGMKQRLAIALALCCEPDILIADDPTSAVDVTIQSQILQLLRDLGAQRGLSILLVTHDLRVVATLCRRVLVIYNGRIVEEGSTESVMRSPRHPYTEALLRCSPSIDARIVPLATVAGSPPQAGERISGCAFHPRCPKADDTCRTVSPDLVGTVGEERVACWHPN